MPNDLQNLITGLQMTDPRLHQFLLALLNNLTEIEDELHPIQQQLQAIIAPAPLPGPPVFYWFEFVYNPGQTYSHVIRLVWISNDPNAVQWEWRKRPLNDLTDDWDMAEFVFRTTTQQGYVNPTPVGTTRFLIKSINVEGEYSLESRAVNVLVHAIGAPALNAQALGSVVNLYWTPPFSVFPFVQFEIQRHNGAIYVPLTTVNGFTHAYTTVEHTPGIYAYRVRGRTATNDYSPYGSVKVRVLIPPIGIFDRRRSYMSNFTDVNTGFGYDVSDPVFVNTVRDPEKYDPPVGTYRNNKLVTGMVPETWEDHFINNSWTNFEDPTTVFDPFFIFAQPSVTVSSYQEVVDFGSLLPADTVVNVIYAYEDIENGAAPTFEFEFSDDKVIWTTPAAGDYAVPKIPFRYIRLTATFTAPGTHDFSIFYNIGVEVVVRTGIDRPAQIVADTNDFDLGEALVIFINMDNPHDITGFVAAQLDGEEKVIINNGVKEFYVKHEGAGSAAENRVSCQGSADITIKAGFMARFIYDMLAERWIGVEE